MKRLLSIIPFLMLLNGCVSDATDDMKRQYSQLRFNMPVDEVLELIGMPDIKYPELLGETWTYFDENHLIRIVIYVSPQKELNISKTSITPRVNIETGRLIYKQWIDHEQAGAS